MSIFRELKWSSIAEPYSRCNAIKLWQMKWSFSLIWKKYIWIHLICWLWVCSRLASSVTGNVLSSGETTCLLSACYLYYNLPTVNNLWSMCTAVLNWVYRILCCVLSYQQLSVHFRTRGCKLLFVPSHLSRGFSCVKSFSWSFSVDLAENWQQERCGFPRTYRHKVSASSFMHCFQSLFIIFLFISGMMTHAHVAYLSVRKPSGHASTWQWGWRTSAREWVWCSDSAQCCPW